MAEKKRRYPEKKVKDVTPEDNARIRVRLETTQLDSWAVAEEFGYSVSQVAGIRSAITKGH